MCLVEKNREAYPNAPGVPYMGHKPSKNKNSTTPKHKGDNNKRRRTVN